MELLKSINQSFSKYQSKSIPLSTTNLTTQPLFPSPFLFQGSRGGFLCSSDIIFNLHYIHPSIHPSIKKKHPYSLFIQKSLNIKVSPGGRSFPPFSFLTPIVVSISIYSKISLAPGAVRIIKLRNFRERAFRFIFIHSAKGSRKQAN